MTLWTASPGTGKTRLLLEWTVQVFQHPCVVASFLAEDSSVDLDITTDIAEQLTKALASSKAETVSKANFLLRLYRATKQCSAITVTAQNTIWTMPDSPDYPRVAADKATEICRLIIMDGIQRQFEGKPIAGDVIPPRGDPVPLFWRRFSLKELMNTFMQLVEQYTTVKDLLPFDKKKGLLLINIDEVQEFVKLSSDIPDKNLAFAIARVFYCCKDLDYSVIINMAGLYTGDLRSFTDQALFFMHPSLPLDPLLHIDYLNHVCGLIYNKSLFGFSSKNGTLPKKLSIQLHQLWVACCGHPRTIEYFVQALVVLGKNKTQLTPQDISKVSVAVGVDLRFNEIKSSLKTPTQHKWNKLLLDCLFCKPKYPADVINDGVKYSDLESNSLIIATHTYPFFSTTAAPKLPLRRYTIPFFRYAQEISEEVTELQGNAKSITETSDVAIEPYPIKIENAIKVYGPSLYDEEQKQIISIRQDTFVAGELLEGAAATSLWLRYLSASDLKHGALVPLNKVIADINCELYAKWTGVVKFTEQGLCLVKDEDNKESEEWLKKCANFDKYAQFVATNGVIAINTVSSHFADVVAPLYDHGGKFKRLLCIQCFVEPNKTTPGNIYSQAKWMMGEGFDTINIVLSPNMDLTPLSERVTASKKTRTMEKTLKKWEHSKELLLSDGTNWLSDWFMITFTDAAKLQ